MWVKLLDYDVRVKGPDQLNMNGGIPSWAVGLELEGLDPWAMECRDKSLGHKFGGVGCLDNGWEG